jgi:CRISPR type III-A-associated RAMP protein Csm4
MNAGLVVKLRPTGPWRIGPDSGARNRVDVIYHSDSLYGAVTSAMARLGVIEEWLEATARAGGPKGHPAVAFSSCFPFLDEVGFVAPPRTVWPPSAPAQLSSRVRWKSARFVPLGIVPALLAGQPLDENQWSVDGPSECLVPVGRPGVFRSTLRWNAAVDRFTGATERHSTACTEFRAGAGLWTVVSFADEGARGRWLEPVKTAFRWLAESGFGGERSRGWGRAEAPEFVEGTLPGMILDLSRPKPPEPAVEAVPEPVPAAIPEQAAEAAEAAPEPAAEPVAEGAASPAVAEDIPPVAPVLATPPAPTPGGPVPQWLLSLFTPAVGDQVDWSRGHYSLVTRAGRVEGSGELKKSVQMVAEGSVIYAATGICGGAPDVAPEGSPHPVYRAGFAVAIPLAEAQ